MSDGSVKVKFFTKEDDETIQLNSENNAPIFAPTSLKRFGLSEIVNHLLQSETPVPFDFLINGEIIRSTTSLEDYLVKNGLSHEVVLNIEYTRAILPPSFLASFQNDDWILSVDSWKGESIISGGYDGIVRTYNMSGQITKQLAGHSGSIKNVKFISDTRIVTSGNDRQLRLWKVKGENASVIDNEEDVENGRTLAILEGHKAPAVNLAVQGDRILSAGYDHVVGFWSTNYKEMAAIEFNKDDEESKLSTASKKRRKLAIQDSTIRRRSPLAMFEGHNQPVEGVIFDGKDSTVGYSCSQDHTVKTWDLVTGKNVDTRTTGYSLLSILHVPEHNLIATGSLARHINLHDPRQDSSSFKKLVGHTNFVVDLAASPTNKLMFVSASHDGTCKVWDVRSDRSMYTITRNDEEAAKAKLKVFGVCWDQAIGIISGGEDKTIQINKGI
ncbi:ribosome biogenesis protein ytm1 [Scheffersomyces spartinae]|uniref:Ribosome biogenesis protein YTM1 n=1 Tax=Scheffersomyces spartinae TaxID=45513 RepID=A0A9P8AIA2_9ASCO|nr:ribosome biogenesis protein ytm1 [Scheffersomyces spartinae]KAG7193648.1 ribosome biogenesis protein ytm1 [Scheffersomyces spartinae]